MTPRSEVSWVNLDDSTDVILQQLQETPHSLLPVCRGQLDNVIGIARNKDLISDLVLRQRIDESIEGGTLRKPIVFPETAGVLKAMDTLKRAHGQLVLVADEFGSVRGLLTPIDILEAIAGEFPDEDEQLAIRMQASGQWEVDGAADLHLLEQVLETDGLVSDEADYTSLAGFLLARFETLPEAGQAMELDGLRYEILSVEDRRIAKVSIRRIGPVRSVEET
jgi:CBS domain containing-hemolysin-like protein